MSSQAATYDDFHLHGASAPEWKQRYMQMTAGTMRSSLAECRIGQCHVFHKWMSERVVQQGCLPAGQVCFGVMSTDARGVPRIQGREVLGDNFFVLRANEEFSLQRPAGLKVLSVVFDAEEFRQLLDERGSRISASSALSGSLLQTSQRSLGQLRRALTSILRASFHRHGANAAPHEPRPGGSALAFELVFDVLSSSRVLSQGCRSASASSLVAQCHLIVENGGDDIPSVETLCRRLNTSRRTLQNSFAEVADTTPGHYLRSVRLDAVRRQLLSATSGLNVTQAAMSQGFTHLGHFTERYHRLYGELPSQTLSRRTRCKTERADATHIEQSDFADLAPYFRACSS